ncbi:MAG TPA: nuclear transport factor 2 family protein [Acidimicrobiales bacterium]|nr:nuclear transport factor 2 family protein [Acidimicrobiales bacterium]
MADDDRAIANVLSRYAELLDDGDFDGLGELFAEGTVRFDGSDDVVSGAAAVGGMYASVVQVHGGSPLTKHVMTNFRIEVGPGGTEARAFSYYTVLQAHPELPLQAVACGRYADVLRKRDGQWRFADRLIYRDLVGDLRFHLRQDPYGETAGA